jgi:anti-anti-sigma factor
MSSSLFLVRRYPPECLVVHDHDGDPVLVQLRGEYDVSTDALLAFNLASAMAFAEEHVVVDLRNTRFIGSSTARMFVRARQHLALQSRTISLRSPTPVARLVLDLCGASGLVECPPDEDRRLAPAASGCPRLPLSR